MGGGVSSAISRALGAGDDGRATALAMHALTIGAGAGLVLFAPVLAFAAGNCLPRLGGRDAVLDQAMAYANVALAAAVLVWLLNTLASIVRGTGNMQIPSLTLLGVSALQIGLAAPSASALARSRASACPAWPRGLVIGLRRARCFCSGSCGRAAARLRLRFGRRALRRRDVLRHPASRRACRLSPASVRLDGVGADRAIARFGTEALAGYGIGARLEFLLVPIAFAVGVACVPMVGMAIGAGDVARARQVAWTGGWYRR